MRPANRPIAIVRGDTYQHLVTFTDDAGDPVDLTGHSYTAQLRDFADAPDILAAMDSSVIEAEGAVWLTIDSTVTAVLEPGRRAWDLEETDVAGLITTVMGGWADVVADVTRIEL